MLALERQVHVSEHESEHYDRRKIIDAARTGMRAKLRGATPGKAAVEKAVDDARASGDPARVEWERLMAAGAQCLKVRERAKAIEHYEAAVKLAETFDPRGLDLGRTLFQLASVHLSAWTWSAAEYPLTRALAILEENLPADHPEVIAACRGLIRVHLEKKEGDRAERLIRRFLPIVEQTRELLHEETSGLLFSLGRALRLQRKHAEADEVYTRYLKAAETAWGPHDLRVTDVVEAMGGNFLEQGNASKAESLYRRALTVREDCSWERYWKGRYWEGRIPPNGQLETVLSALADLLTKQGRYEEAEKHLRRLLDLAVDKAGAAGKLAAVLRKMGRAEEADEIESDALTDFYRWYRGD
jgi:tetratricopeptide (TPR) repeat protein